MALTLRINGSDYDYFTDAEVERSLDAVTSTFSFAATASDGTPIQINEGDLIEVIADGQLILTGYIDEFNSGYDASTHGLSIKGRSKTQDIVDCTVQSSKEFSDITLFRLCSIVSTPYNITVIDDVNDSEILKEISSAAIGQKVFKFIEPFARKRQVLLTDNELGNLVITRSSKEISPIVLKNKIGDIENNIKRANKRINIANLYGKYVVQGQKNPASAEFLSAGQLSNQTGTAVDSGIRSIRQLEFYSEETSESGSLSDRAQWELSVRRARNFEYTCTVAGFTSNGVLYKSNILHTIIDDSEGLNDEFLCKKVKYSYSIDSGSETTLTFTSKNAYTLEELDEQALAPGTFEFLQ